MVDPEEDIADNNDVPEELRGRARNGNIRGNKSDVVLLFSMRFGSHIDYFDGDELTDEDARNLAEQMRLEK